MPSYTPAEKEFLKKVSRKIEENISNEQFGVSELASSIGMSRSNLLRKIKKLTGLSASRFISQVRLEKAMEMLKKEDYTVSEVTFKVGFNSTSYFIKCFREHYGYPPGEVQKHLPADEESDKDVHPATHQLSAIMFTDIQGYTSLMQQDESEAVKLRNRHREIFDRLTKKYKGKILQYYGDGTLSTFGSAIQAVKCAVDLQLEFRSDPLIPVRIGIHTGDVIFTDDDIIGDGVNLAARLEALAEAGSVFISEKVHDEIKNQPDIESRFMGKYDLKNVKDKMKVYAIANDGLIVPRRRRSWLGWSVAAMAILVLSYLVLFTDLHKQAGLNFASHAPADDLSIAVLPFINDSDDSTNIYFINGLMESTLNDLQKIRGLRVISRTSVEKYRNKSKAVAEIAEELQVKYIVEGSGQKRDDQIFLHIQLIEAATDKHLMSEQYISETSDIFQLQLDIARQIAGKIELVLSPDEQKLISSSYSDDPVAYDLFLKGRDRLNQGTEEGLYEGMDYLQQAIRQDPDYARAYAAIGIAYYYADFFKAEHMFTDSINYYADLALFHDAELATGMLAKAMFYLRTSEHGLALPYLEKALEYNPNSTLVLNMLSDYYANISPDTEKYLEYAIRGMSIDPAPNDSIQTSLAYLHIANALVQSGFVDEARRYAERSLLYDPTNIYSMYVEEYIKYAKERDIEGLCQGLVEVLKVDTSRLDVLQETAKSYYFARNYKEAYRYYRPLVDIRKAYSIDIFDHENAKIGFVYRENGFETEADSLLAIYKEYSENDQSIYKQLSMAAYSSFYDQTDEAMEHLRLFLEEENYFYWIILFLDIEPLFDSLKSHPEYKGIIKEIKSKFWNYHEEMRVSLEEKGVI